MTNERARPRYDVAILGGAIVDGSGAPARRGDEGPSGHRLGELR